MQFSLHFAATKNQNQTQIVFYTNCANNTTALPANVVLLRVCGSQTLQRVINRTHGQHSQQQATMWGGKKSNVPWQQAFLMGFK